MPGWTERLGRERMLFNARAAIERYQALQAEGGRRLLIKSVPHAAASDLLHAEDLEANVGPHRSIHVGG